MGTRAETGRKNRILDAAEQIFAERGFDGASLRSIVNQAKVNLATVYYYFASKEGLLAAVFQRRFGPLQAEHFAQLNQLEQAADGQPVPVKKILEAMLRPPLRLAGTTSARSQAVMRLIGRMVTEPNPQFQDLLRNQHEAVRTAYLSALRRSLPQLPAADLQWRFEFFWGALAFILCNPRKIEKMSGGTCNPADTETVVAQMIACFAAGLHAPAVGPRSQTISPRGKKRLTT